MLTILDRSGKVASNDTARCDAMIPARLNALAHRLATEHATEIIESECAMSGYGSGLYDTKSLDSGTCARNDVNRAVSYLNARGLLVRDPQRREFVRIKGRR